MSNPTRMIGVLDELGHIGRVDASDMLSAMRSLPDQLEASLSSDVGAIGGVGDVIVCGMGGSAMSGDVLQDAGLGNAVVPISVMRGLSVPNWADESTLAVMISYSGNTRETLSMFEDANDKGCNVVGICSGGRLLERCEAEGHTVMAVEGGLQPRAAMGLLLGSAANVMQSAGVMPMADMLSEAIPALRVYMGGLVPSVPTSRNPAKTIASRLSRTVPIVYGPRSMRSAALRWQTQINENAKMLALNGEFPEMNHNHIVGWLETSLPSPCLPVFLSDGRGTVEGAMESATMRMFERYGTDHVEVTVPGETVCERLLMTIALGDMVSYYLAMLKGIDPTPVEAIVRLKGHMADTLDPL